MNNSLESIEANKFVVKRFSKETFENFNVNARSGLVAENFRSHAWSGFENRLKGMKHFAAFIVGKLQLPLVFWTV
jgi:hypothetical protein